MKTNSCRVICAYREPLLVVLLTACQASYTLCVKLANRGTLTTETVGSVDPDAPFKYHTSVVNLFTEFLKFCATFGLILSSSCHSRPILGILRLAFCHQFRNFIYLCIPAVIYAVQTHLVLHGLSRLDIATFQVMCQMKIFSVVFFSTILMDKQYSRAQLLALGVLGVGETLVHFDRGLSSTTNKESNDVSYTKGIVSTVYACIGSGFAGVYYELRLKRSPQTDFWISNLQLYAWGILINSSAILFLNHNSIATFGYLHGFNTYVWLMVVLAAVNGMTVSLVLSLLSSVWKCFASSLSVVVTAAVACFLFGVVLKAQFYVGAFLVFSALCLYNLG